MTADWKFNRKIITFDVDFQSKYDWGVVVNCACDWFATTEEFISEVCHAIESKFGLQKFTCGISSHFGLNLDRKTKICSKTFVFLKKNLFEKSSENVAKKY